MFVLDDFVKTLRGGSRQYFESKPMRGVKLEEFSVATVPENTTDEVLEVLKRRGLKVKKVRTNRQSDEFMAKQENLFFQYLLGAAGGGAAVGAASKAVQGPELMQEGPSPLLQPY